MQHGEFHEIVQSLSTAVNHLSDTAVFLADGTVPALGLPGAGVRGSPPEARSGGAADTEISLSDISAAQLGIGTLLSQRRASGGSCATGGQCPGSTPVGATRLKWQP